MMSQEQRFTLVINTWLTRQACELKESKTGDAKRINMAVDRSEDGTLRFAVDVSKWEILDLVHNLMNSLAEGYLGRPMVR